MTFSLRRTTDGDLALTREHQLIVAPRKGPPVDFASFKRGEYHPDDIDRAATLWRTRALQEMHSLALFTQLLSQIHLLGAPLDWSGAFARMIEDEVRHTDLCLRMCEALGKPEAPTIVPDELHLASDRPPRAHVRDVVAAAFCIGETVSGLMFKQSLRAATVPLARDVVTAILVDETFHGELGWELMALLMREIDADERTMLARRLPFLVSHYAKLCGATQAPARARASREREPSPNFGELTNAGYACAFFDAMDNDIVPAFVAVGLPEAVVAYDALTDELNASARD
jgi:hypothetical protein